MEKNLKNILQDQIQVKGYTLDKLRRETGIAERYLTALLEGNHANLPASPYVRAYLIKLASLLDLDAHALWGQYRADLGTHTSGPEDKLPINRFALKKANRSWLIAGVFIILFLIYGVANINRFLGRPNLTLSNPAVETLVTTANIITLSGSIDPEDKLVIDGEQIVTDSSGNFSTEYSLAPGLNRIEFSVKKLLGKEIKISRTVIYQEP